MTALDSEATDRPRFRATDHRLLVWGWIVIAAASALAVVRFVGTPPPGRDSEALFGALAFGAVVGAPGVLMMMAVRRRQPDLLTVAGLVLIPLSFISFALVTLPLLIPAFISLHAWSHVHGEAGGPLPTRIAVAVTTSVILGAAFIALLVHEDPREWTGTTVDGGVVVSVGYGTSDIITYTEASISLALTGAALLIGGLAGASRSTRSRPASGTSATAAHPSA